MNEWVMRFFSAPSNEEWWRLLFVFLGLLGTIGVGEAVRSFFRWSSEFTRKLVHVSVGILIFFAPPIFSAALPAIVLALFFIVSNFLAIKLGLLKGMHATTRATYGTVYYPLSFLILVFMFWYDAPLIMTLSILVLALGDAAAAIVGESHQSPTVYRLTSDKKSVEGSLAMFLVTFVTIFSGIKLFALPHQQSFDFLFAVSGVTASIATAWEAISSRGLDNLTVPLSTAFVLSFFLLPHPFADSYLLVFGTALAIGIALISYYFRFLTLSGSVATFLLASLIFGIGSWKWTVPILAFFVLSSILSRLGRRKKLEIADIFEKGSRRDHIQVAANGGIGGILILLSYYFPETDFYPYYLASIAAVTADTWSTEIGLLGRGKTYLITTFREVRPGVNGGISLRGTLGGLLGGLTISAVARFWVSSVDLLVMIALAGLLASLVDSLLGATIQATYECSVCGKRTERKDHCSVPGTSEEDRNELVAGYRSITNDSVNLLCALSGVLLLYLFLV